MLDNQRWAAKTREKIFTISDVLAKDGKPDTEPLLEKLEATEPEPIKAEALRVEMHPVESDNVAFVGWSDGDLYVEFRNAPKTLYRYKGVPYSGVRGSFQGLLKAASANSYLRARIINRFPFEKVAQI